MLLYKEIIKEENQDLRKKSSPVDIPLSKEDLKTLDLMNEYLISGYDDKLVEKFQIRPGVGIAAPQIDILKQMFVIAAYDELDRFYHCGFINPKIISHSEELTFLKGGEGCLSVEREVKGLVHRPKRIKVSTYIYDFDQKAFFKATIKLEGYLAVVFQHEYDHLSGILFVDRINQTNPFFVPENSHPIVFKQIEENNTNK